MEIPKEKLLEMYRNLLTARRLDEKLKELFAAGGSGMPFLHIGTGEEAIPIAVCANLRKDDYIKVSGVRASDCLFAKGFSLTEVIAGECTRDISKVGGHDNYFTPDYGTLGKSFSLSEDIPIYLGAAISAMLRKTKQVCVCTIGEGAANRGPVWEAMVLAAAWKKVPIVFIIQNNQYCQGTPIRESYAIKDLSDRAKAFGFPGQSVDGNDVIAIYEVVHKYVERARSGGGPSLIVANTYRLGPHFIGDPQLYRPKGEAEQWWEKDPLPRYQKRLMEMGILTEKDVSNLETEIKAEIEEAAKAALAVPLRSYEDHIKTAIAEL